MYFENVMFARNWVLCRDSAARVAGDSFGHVRRVSGRRSSVHANPERKRDGQNANQTNVMGRRAPFDVQNRRISTGDDGNMRQRTLHQYGAAQ